MIIFDLDGTLSCPEHRRHFVDADKFLDTFRESPNFTDKDWLNRKLIGWQPDYQSFYEACDKDEPIQPVIDILSRCVCTNKVEIWSGRCESVREKTLLWLDRNLHVNADEFLLRMRPIGDYTPDDELKERWIDGILSDYGRQLDHEIDFVFDSDPKSIAMWRRRGIFVFDCNQDGREF